MKKNLINPATLLAWQEIDPSNWKALASDITKIFFDAGSIQMKQLMNEWSRKNLDGVRRAAHSLKSSCGNVGAHQAHDLLDQIEKASARADIEKVTILMKEFEPMFSESCNQISEFVRTLQAA